MDQRDLSEMKATLHQVWSAGDYSKIAKTLEPGAATFLRRMMIEEGEKVLDAACGTGQIALPAARAGAVVTGIDIAEPWIEAARMQAAAEGLAVTFDVGDVEEMPYADGAFELSVSLVGAMFAPQPERTAAELLRVTRPGGRVVMGNWTAEGFIGTFFRTVAAYAPPPPMPSPLLWGDEACVRERFAAAASVELSRHPYRLQYETDVADTVQHYFDAFGPTKMALSGLEADRQAALRRDLEVLFAAHNVGTAERVAIEAEILDVVAVKG